MLNIRNRPELGWKTKTRRERRVYLFDELLFVVREAIGNRAHGPLFMLRDFADGKALPQLAGMSVQELAVELSERSKAAGADREAEERIAKHLWRDMGAAAPKEVRADFIRVAKKIGRPDLTCPKLWRHQMATAMQEADVDPFVRKEVIGHTRLETTGIYTHTSAAVIARQMEKMVRLREPALEVLRNRVR
jgi:integrase